MQRTSQPFGLRISTASARELAEEAVAARPSTGVALVVTPNIDHIAMLRRSPALARAYTNAARVVCDGWPVQLYTRLCGQPVQRVTGCEITAELMNLAPYAGWHRFFFVVDSAVTQTGVQNWAARNNVACDTAIPPFGFERDSAYCTGLAQAIARHDTTVLIMAVGAPRSEIFIDTHRAVLPNCSAFCVGQAVKIELGLVKRASASWQSVGMEWLWRLRQEPLRLARRYATAAVGFGCAVVEDQTQGGLRNLRVSPR